MRTSGLNIDIMLMYFVYVHFSQQYFLYLL